MKIIFQDVDGPLIPGRMYYAKHATYSHDLGAFLYDPVAVGMIRELCRKHGAKVVYNTAHNEEDFNLMRYKARVNDMEDLLHDDCRTDFVLNQEDEIPSRRAAIERWLARHPEVTSWVVIDDESNIHPTRQVTIDFNLGMTINSFFKAEEILSGQKQSGLILP